MDYAVFIEPVRIVEILKWISRGRWEVNGLMGMVTGFENEGYKISSKVARESIPA